MDQTPQARRAGAAPRLRRAAVLALLAAAVLAVFLPLRHARFLTYDDPNYVSANPMVQHGLDRAAAAWAFTTFHTGNWHPLTWLSHMLDYRLFALDAGRHHAASVAVHLAASATMFLALDALTGRTWAAALTAILFAIHPLHVQSVAWVAERKDLLCGLCAALTLAGYRRYVARPGWRRFPLVLAPFAAGLLAKPMLVTLPLVLLLLDYWPLGRLPATRSRTACAGPTPSWKMPLLEKLPLFALAAASSVVTWVAQASGGTVSSLSAVPAPLRALNAVVAYGLYLRRTLWPSDLAVFYPLSRQNPPLWQPGLALLALVLVSAAAARQRRRLPFLAVGWLWFLGTLVPVIGLVQVGEAALADRYTYLPLVGLFLAGACALGDLVRRSARWRPALALAAATALVALGGVARRETAHWHDDRTLFTRALEVTTGNWVALGALGSWEMEAGRLDRAANLFLEAIHAKPENALAYNNLAIVRLRQGQVADAVDLLQTVTGNDPDFADAHFNLARAYERLGRPAEAARHYREVLRINQGDRQARYLLGKALENAGTAAPSGRGR